MQLFFLTAIAAFLVVYTLKRNDQKSRIVFLSRYLENYRIEKLMETLTQGYLRALGESDPVRRDQIFGLLSSAEADLNGQFDRFASEFAKAPEVDTRITLLSVPIPYAARLFPTATFDARKAFAIHAEGIRRAAQDDETQSQRDRAFVMSAELFLMQHTCHWFCRSKGVASARMMLRHQTRYEQLIESVSPETRDAYLTLTRQRIAPA